MNAKSSAELSPKTPLNEVVSDGFLPLALPILTSLLLFSLSLHEEISDFYELPHFIHSITGGHLGLFLVWTIMNSAAMCSLVCVLR